MKKYSERVNMKILVHIIFFVILPQSVFAGEVVSLNFNICNQYLFAFKNQEIPRKNMLALTEEGKKLNLNDPRLKEASSYVEGLLLKPFRLSSSMVTSDDLFALFHNYNPEDQVFKFPMVDLIEENAGQASTDFSTISKSWGSRAIDILNTSISYLALYAHRNSLPVVTDGGKVENKVKVGQVNIVDALPKSDFDDIARRIVRFPQWRNPTEKYFQIFDDGNYISPLATQIGSVDLVVDIAGLGSRRSVLEMTKLYSKVLIDEGYLLLWLPTILYIDSEVRLLNEFPQSEVDVFSNIPDFTLVGLYKTPKAKFSTIRLEDQALNQISPPYEGISVILKRNHRNQRNLTDTRLLLPIQETISPEGVRKLSVGLKLIQ